MLIIRINIALPENELQDWNKLVLGDEQGDWAKVLLKGELRDWAKIELEDVLGDWTKLGLGVTEKLDLFISLFSIVLEDNFAKIKKK